MLKKMKRKRKGATASTTRLEDLGRKTAADIMSSPVVTARVHDSLEHVARLFTEKHVGSVAVLNELDEPVGVLTTTDLAWFARTNANRSVQELVKPASTHLAWQSALERTTGTISPWMSRRVYSVSPRASLREVAGTMLKKGLHHLFVKGADGKGLQGIVTTKDLVRELAAALPAR